MSYDAVVIVSDGASAAGGAERVAIANALGLADRGLRVGFFGAEGTVEPEIRDHPGIVSRSLGLADAYHAGKAQVLRRFLWNAPAGEALHAFLKDFDPARTIVHVHSFRRILSGAAPLAIAGFRSVVTLHDFGLACPNTGLYDFTKRRICPLTPLSPACFARQCTHSGWPAKILQQSRAVVNGPLRHVWDAFGAFVHVSEFSRGILERYVPKGRPQIVVDNPVTVERRPRVGAERNDEFVFAGRLVPEKGATVFARAAALADVKAVFVGEGPDREAVALANPWAQMAGWLSGEEVQRRIAGARAVVFPSVWLETAGLAALEALARGVPVIVSGKCAAAQYVADGVTGRHFETGSVEALARVLKEHLEGDVAPMSRAAYERYWADPFTPERYLDRIEGVYASL